MDTSNTRQTMKPIAQEHNKQLQILLFGDQTAAADLQSYIKVLYQQCSRSSSLRVFMQTATDTLQKTITDLNLFESRHFPSSFQSVLDLAELYERQDGTKDIVLSTLLLCIAQLGSLIMYDMHPFLVLAEDSNLLLLYSEKQKKILFS